MNVLEQLARTLKTRGVSVTTQRTAVFRALQGQEPLSMRQVLERCPGVDRASVYRTVALFERLDIVQRLQTGWKYRLELSGIFHQHHHHATCIQCGATIALPEDPVLEDLLRTMSERAHFTLTAHQLELQGYCTACATAPDSANDSPFKKAR